VKEKFVFSFPCIFFFCIPYSSVFSSQFLLAVCYTSVAKKFLASEFAATGLVSRETEIYHSKLILGITESFP